MHRLPPLNALRAFEAVARQGTLTRAAEELHVTPTAVSAPDGTVRSTPRSTATSP